MRRWLILIAAAVGLAYVERNHRQTDHRPTPRLEGRIATLLPAQLSVPNPYSLLLARQWGETPKSEATPAKGPRFTATVCWGANYEPWIADLRLVESTSPRPR